MKNVKNIVKVAKYLSTVKEASTDEIEKNNGLSQPEVSTTISDMYGMHLIAKIRVPNSVGRGRPRIICKLLKSFEEIEEYIKNQIYNELLLKGDKI